MTGLIVGRSLVDDATTARSALPIPRKIDRFDPSFTEDSDVGAWVEQLVGGEAVESGVDGRGRVCELNDLVDKLGGSSCVFDEHQPPPVPGHTEGRYRIGVMSNCEDRRLPLVAASLVASELGWDAIAMPPAATTDDPVASLLGTYVDDSHTVVLASDPVRGLAMTVDDQPPIPLSFVPPDLTAPGMALTMRLGTNDEGSTTLTVRQPGLKLELVRRNDG